MMFKAGYVSRLALVILAVVTVLSAGSCKRKSRLDIDLSEVYVSPEFYHFEEALFEIPDTLFFERFPEIYPAFAPLFMQREPDSLLMVEMLIFSTEPRYVELYEKKREVLVDMGREIDGIISVLKHYKYYYPDSPDHDIYTHISGLDMSLIQSPVILNDTLAIISTDLFLGKEFEPYIFVAIPEYRRRWMIPGQVAPEFARQLAFLKAGSPENAETLLEQMLFQGKILYFLDAMMPRLDDTAKVRYTKKQLQWCFNNQRHVWTYIINNQMLYSTDHNHAKLLILDAPFTAVFSESAPGRIGHWIGWQIVRKYMDKNPGVTLHELMGEDDAQKILMASGYKPR